MARMVRGGYSSSGALNIRGAARDIVTTNTAFGGLGLRCARVP